MLVSSTPARLRFVPSWAATVIIALVLALGLVAVPVIAQATEPVGSTTGVTVTSTGDTVLAGGSGRVTVKAANPSGVDLYNATVVVVLPVGVTYVSGSAPASPSGPGEPTIQSWIPDPNDPDAQNPYTGQVLVWENVADLPLGAATQVGFAVRADDARYPVGSTFDLGAGVYANSNERVVPTVTVPASGAPTVTDATEGGSVDTEVTVIALTVSKAETANPEAEVYRGPANPATWTVTVRTAPMAGSDDVIVEDYVPATFTVLGCADGEYTCEVVSIDGEVFTKLTWNLGDIPAGRTIPLTYDAYVGLREVTLPGASAPGAPTRPTTGGYSVTNTVDASATYTGDVASGGSNEISTSAEATVTVLDVGIVKSVAAGDFAVGGTKQYSFTVRTSEYVDASGITVVDTIPDGMCPVLPAGVTITGDAWPAECAPARSGTGTVTGEGAMESVDFDAATGEFTVSFSVQDRDEDEDATVGYAVFMRSLYQDGTRTASGDSFTNTVHLEGTVDPVPANTVDTGSAPGDNGSSATVGTSGVSLTKTVWENTDRRAITGVSGSGTTCTATSDYTSPSASDSPALQLGDLVCFRIDATFPTGVATRDVLLTDFLPIGTSMVAWSASTGAGRTSVAALDAPAATSTRWRLGEQTGSAYYVAPGDSLQLYVLGRIHSVPATQPRITGNLAKMRYTSGDGSIVALRDDVGVRLAPAPPLSLDKKVNGLDALSPVQEGQALTFTIDVSHNGTAGGLNDYPLDEIEVWDLLPAGFDCDDITTASPAISAADCTTRGDGRVVVRWILDLSADTLRGGETTRISYTLAVPSPLSVSSAHTNTAAVTRFTSVSTNGIAPSSTGPTFYPTNPVGAFPSETKNAAQAADSTTITLAGADVDKSVSATGVTETGNTLLTQATIGETVTWTYTATVPAKTSLFNGILDEQPPAQSRWVAVGTPTLTSSVGGIVSAAGCAPVAGEFRLCTDPADQAFGDLFFPTTWTNTGTAAATFTVTLTMRVANDTVNNTHGAALTNTAVLTSTPTTTNTGAVERDRDSAGVSIVLPSPAVAKNVSLTGASGPWSNADTNANGGQTVYYRLTASNAAGRPPLHETVIVDCIDSRLSNVTNLTNASVATVSAPVAGDGTNGCAVGRTKYTWTLTADLAGTAAQIVYSAQVPSPIPASSTFRNDAALSGTTMPGDVTGERTLTASASRTVTAAIPTISKARTSPSGSAVPGETVSWRVTVTVPAGVNLYEARILDTLPTQLGTAAGATFTVTCAADWTGVCPTATRLAAPGATPQVLGVYLDDIASAATARTLYLDISSPVLTSVAVGAVTATNNARISWNTVDTTPPTTAIGGTATSGTVSATVDIRHPLVTVAKSVSDSASRKVQGQIFTYTVTATASGAAANNKTAHNVVVVDTVPSGVVPVVSTTDGTPLADGASTAGGVWNAAARTITWQLTSLAVGAPQSFTYPAKLAPASTLSGGALTNSVVPQSWTSLATDGKSYGPGTAATTAVTPGFPLINTAKSQTTANPVYIGDEVTFQVTLTNAGTATAASMSAVDTLPTGWTYVAGSTVIDGSAAGNPTVSGQTLTWAGLGTLTTSQQHTITYRAVAGSSVSVGSGSAHTNTAVAAQVTDATGGTSYNGGAGSYIGSQGQVTARIHQADLQIAKTAGTFTAGGQGTFQLVVRNSAGSDPAVGVTVTDTLTLPTGVTFVSATGTGWTCGSPDGSGVLTCQRTNSADTLAAGASFPTITVRVAVAAGVASGTTVPNTATVAARTEDRTPANNTSSASGSVITRADLAVSKTVVSPATGPVTAGEAIEWAVTLTNNGPSVSRGSAGAPIVLTDTLPSRVSDVELVGTVPAGCAIAGGTLTCSLASDIAVGETITVRFAGTVDSDVAAGDDLIVNSASVTPVTTDPVAGNNTSTVRTDVVVEEDLTIVKQVIDPAPPAAVVPGETVSYRITVGNRGPSDARGVYIVDTLPAATAFDAITAGASAWTATVTGDTVRFTLSGDLAAGDDAPVLEYRVTLDAAFVGDADDLVNTATVSSTWRADQQTDTAQPGPAQPSADLEVTKAVRPSSGAAGDPVRAGETAVYTLTVDNLGPSDADEVTLTDTLPTGLSFVAPLPAGCSIDGQDLTCVKASGLDVGETPWVVQITVRVAASFQGSTLTNAAEATSTTADPVPGNNIDDVDLPVIQRAHLTITKQASGDEVRAGEDVEWTITIANDGPSDAQGVSLTDVLDPRLVLVDIDADDAIACTGTASLTCTIGTIPAGGEVELTVTTTVRSSVVDGASVPNSATVSSSTIDTVTGEPTTATDGDSVDVVAVSALTIVKTATQPTVDAGGNAVFRIAVGNDGPSDAAASVVVTDTLPDGMTFVSASTIGGPAQWSCAADEQDVVCELQDADGDAVTLAADTDAPVLQIVAAVDASLTAGELENTATVTSPSEPTPPTDEVTVEVQTFADLGITKVNVGTPTAGERFSWTIEVTNHGPSDSVATAGDPIVITDTLPDGVTFVSATGAGADCAADAGDVRCEITSTLAPEETVTVTLTVDVAEDVSGTLSNTAVVAPGLTPEPAAAVWPNEATAVTPTVIEEADLAIEKTVVTDPSDIVAGQPIRWELTVTNLGPSDSDADADHPIVVTDTLPAGVTATAASGGSAWECVIGADGTTVACELASDLATGDPQVITIDAVVGADVQGTIVNTAAVEPGLTPQPADSTANDEDSVSSTVDEAADLRLLKDVRTAITAGGTGTYLIQVFNDGPSTARDVTVTDTLPSVLTFERVVVAEGETSPWTCTVDAADPTEVVCTYAGDIAPSADPVELILEVAAASDLTGDVSNRATVDASTPDPDETDNSDSIIGVLVTTADLAIAKSHDVDAQAVAGEEFTWTLTVTNNGPSDSVASSSTPIVVTDTLPAGATFVEDGSDAACAPADGDAQQVVCEITSTIADGESVSFDVRVALDEDLTGDITNAAVVASGGTADGDLTNNRAEDAVTITEVADLTVVKEVATAEGDIVAGRQIAWTVRVSNNGPSNSDATEDDPITVVDTLPADVTFVSAEGDGWTCVPGEATEDGRETIVCERVTDLAVGDAPLLTVTGLIAPDAQGAIRNDVEVTPGLTAEPADGGVSNNASDAVAPVSERTDLALSKAVSETITAGGSGAYTLTVTNLGPSSARGVAVTDTLPEGLAFAGVVGDHWTCEPSAGADVVCTFDGVLAPAASVSFVLGVDAASDLRGDIVNTAVVSTSTPDTNADNDTASAPGTLVEIADLSIVKTAVGTPRVGETFAYELSVRNAGPSDAVGVRVSDLVPAGLEIVGVAGDGWDCAVDGTTNQVLCLRGTLAAGAAAPVITLEVRVLAAAYPEVTNTATVTATTPEDAETLGDNSSTAVVAVPALSDLVITKTLLDELVTGKQARYEVTVVNEGPTEDPGPITITDALPAGLIARSAQVEGADGACENTASTVTCTIDGPAVGQSVTVTLTVDVAADAVGTVVNVATVVSEADPTPSQATAEGEVTVVDLASSGGVLAPYLPFGVALLLLGAAAVWWARRQSVTAE